MFGITGVKNYVRVVVAGSIMKNCLIVRKEDVYVPIVKYFLTASVFPRKIANIKAVSPLRFFSCGEDECAGSTVSAQWSAGVIDGDC
jgi:hypothetical protein